MYLSIYKEYQKEYQLGKDRSTVLKNQKSLEYSSIFRKLSASD